MNRCPVCLRNVKQIPGERISYHNDHIGERCIASGQPFYITVVADFEYKLRRAA